MTRVIHTGDTHLGYQQYHSPARRQDFLDAFERVVDDAVADDVDAVVHAGDLFHDRRPALPDLIGTISVLRRLRRADVPFLAVVGNHESTRGGQWLDLFEQLGLAIRLGSEPVTVGDVAFYGLDHVPPSKRDDLDYAFDAHDADFAALVAHGLFTPFAHADWETETVLAEATVDFDAVLLGDNHAPGTERVADTPVTYCGSTERVSAAERDGRGYNLVAFADDRVDIRRRAVDTRPFVFVEVTLADGEGEERVREQVRQYDLSDAVVVVEITGDGDPVTPASIERLATEQGALVARVTDRREFERADDTAEPVDFADPDEAVRERVTELGLSPAALDVDDAVRGDVADTNVRETVKRRLTDRLDDLSAFEPADADADVDTDTDADVDIEAGDVDRIGSSPNASPPAQETQPGPDQDGDTDREERDDWREPTGAESEADTGGAAAADDADVADVGDEADSAAESDTETDGESDTETDGQVSMEDFL
jgi:DNA repair exonuclease SbcCD nuclease subunit